VARPRGRRQRSPYAAQAQTPRRETFTIAHVYDEMLQNLPARQDDAAAMRWAIEQARRTDRGHEHKWPSGNDPETKRTLAQYARDNVRDWLRAYRQRFS